jgi:SulP family sulfate permease
MDRAPRFGIADVVAGLSVALVLIPQSLAYAELAGLPAYYGLYASGLPPLAAAFFASSPYLQTGPVALTSLLTFGALHAVAGAAGLDAGASLAALAALLALVVGLARLAIGLVRAGFVAYFLSQPVLVGFTTAATILIIASQLPTAMGAEPLSGGIVGRAWWTVIHPGTWHPPAVALTVVTIALVLGGRRVHALFPGVLVAVGVGIGYSTLVGYGEAVLGQLPPARLPLSLDLPWRMLPALVLPGAVIALVGFAEAAAIARTFAAHDRTPWSPDREFVSQGVANLVSGLTSGFPVGGSFSRSSLNRLSGGRTRWSGAVTGLAVLAFLPVAGVLAPLPRAVLAGIVIAAVVKMAQFPALIRMARYARLQAAVGWLTFGATLFLSPRIDQAVVLGIGLAIGLHLWRELKVAVESDYEGTTLRLEPHGVLYFASAPWLDEALDRQLAAHPETERVVIDLRHLGRIDFTGALVLKGVADEVKEAGLPVEFEGIPPHASKVLERVLGEKWPAAE